MPEKEPLLDQKHDPKDSERTVLGDLRAAAEYFDMEIDDSWVENGLQELRERGIHTYAQSLADIQEKYPRMPLSRQSLMAQMQLEVVPDEVETEDYWDEMSRYYSETPPPAHQLWGYESLADFAEDMELSPDEAAVTADRDIVNVFNNILRTQLKVHSDKLQTAFEELDQDGPSIVVDQAATGFNPESSWLREARFAIWDAYREADTMRPVWQPYVDKVFEAIQNGEHVVAMSGPFGIGKSSVFMPMLHEKLEEAGLNIISAIDVRDMYDGEPLPDTDTHKVAIIDEATTLKDDDPENAYGYLNAQHHANFMNFAKGMLDDNKQLVLVVPGANKDLRRNYVRDSAPLLDTEILHSVEVGTLHLPEEPVRVMLKGLGKDDGYINFFVSQPFLMGPRSCEIFIRQCALPGRANTAVETESQLKEYLREWCTRKGQGKGMGLLTMQLYYYNPLEVNWGSSDEAIRLYEALDVPLPDPKSLHYMQLGDPMDRG